MSQTLNIGSFTDKVGYAYFVDAASVAAIRIDILIRTAQSDVLASYMYILNIGI